MGVCALPGAAGRIGMAAVAVLGALSANGCAVERPARNNDQMKLSHAEFVNKVVDERIALSKAVMARWNRELDEAAKDPSKPAPVFDMLVISGGADYGAFGAGVLKGWAEVKDPAHTRPKFDLVSGVSTGALIAPLAFADTEESYERAFQTYQHPKADWFIGRGLLNFLLRQESYADNAGLRIEAQKQIDDSILQAITRGAAEDRVLIIGTTNLDQGMLRMWELTALARDGCSDEKVKKRIYDVIMASASIPGAFPPVEIDGDLYVDGAVTRNIAYTTDQESEFAAVRMWEKAYPGRAFPKVRMWVIVNNQLGTAPRSVNAPWPDQLKRTLEIAGRANTIASLKSLWLSAQLGRERKKGEVEFHFIAIPDDWRPPVEGLFKKETMQALAELGYALGKDPKNWSEDVPDPESPSRITLEKAVGSPEATP